MRLSTFLVFLFLAAAATAQQAEVDAELVRDCFAEARADGGVPSCAGDAADACRVRPGGGTTLGISQCLMAETQVWVGLMNAAIARQAEAFGRDRPELVAELHAVQDAWVAYRDAECGLRYAIWVGGSIRTIVAGSCHLRKTAARALELRDLGSME